MRATALWFITTSLRASCVATHLPWRITLQRSIGRRLISQRPASTSVSACSISSCFTSVKKPREPRLTPRMGISACATQRAVESSVPSPPRTMTKSGATRARSSRSAGSQSEQNSRVDASPVIAYPCLRSQPVTWTATWPSSGLPCLEIMDAFFIRTLCLLKFRVQQKFPVSFHSEDGRFHQFYVLAAQFFHFLPDFHHCVLLSSFVFYDPALSDALAPNFKLRLD